jgi:hypothetical protein
MNRPSATPRGTPITSIESTSSVISQRTMRAAGDASLSAQDRKVLSLRPYRQGKEKCTADEQEHAEHQGGPPANDALQRRDA